MGSQIDIQTGNEYADEEQAQLKIHSIGQNCKQPKASKTTQSNLTEAIVECDEIEEKNVAKNEKPNISDKLVTDCNHPEIMDDRKNNSKNTFTAHLQSPIDASQIKLEKSHESQNPGINSRSFQKFQNFAKNEKIPLPTFGINQLTGRCCNEFTPHHCVNEAKYCHSTCSHQISHFSPLPSTTGRGRNCQRCPSFHDNMKNSSCCDSVCRMDHYKSATNSAIHTNELAKTKENEIFQTSRNFKICQKRANRSKPMHRQAQPESNFVKPNAYSRQKCICKGICEKSSRKHRRVNLSAVNTKKVHASNQMLTSTSNHRHKAGCRCIVSGLRHRNSPKYDVVKCRNSGRRHILRKYRNDRSNGVRHYLICHSHSNNRNHSTGLHHICYCKHY